MRCTRAVRCGPVVPGFRSITTVDGKTGSEIVADCGPPLAPTAASNVASGSRAPRPRETWSVSATPIDGSVTVPTILTWRAYGGLPTVTVSPIFLPSSATVSAPSSTCPVPDNGRPLVVGGATSPVWRCSPTTGTSRPSTGSWVNAISDHPATLGCPPTRWLMVPGVKPPYPLSAWMSTSQFQPNRAGWLVRSVRLTLNTTAATMAVTATMDPPSVLRTGTGR